MSFLVEKKIFKDKWVYNFSLIILDRGCFWMCWQGTGKSRVHRPCVLPSPTNQGH